MKKRIKLALAGYGRRGRSLLRLATGYFHADAAAVCDTGEANLKAAERDYPKAAFFHDFNRMLGETEPDAVLVETPANLHASLCAQALARNVHVMSDVPAADTLEEAQTLWQAQKKSRAIYMLGANPNMWGFADAAADLVRRGVLGEIYHMESEYIHDLRELLELTPWRKTYESIRYCTHSLGPLLRLINEDLEWVSCFGTGSHVDPREKRHDAMTAILRTPSNVVVRFTISFANNYPALVHGYRVYGTRGYFERRPAVKGAGPAKTLYYSTVHHHEKKLHAIPVGEAPTGSKTSPAGEHGGADYALLDRFFTSIREGKPTALSLREGLRMTIPGIAAAESARAGGKLTKIVYPWSLESDENPANRQAREVRA